jgi:type VI secretion system secreted protein VgrG
VRPDYSSKENYVDSNLADEGAATLNNIKVQRDLKAAGGPDIGIAGNRENHQAYNTAYDQFESDGDEAAARHSIGRTFGTGETSSVQVDGKYVNYNEYYGSSWKGP